MVYTITPSDDGRFIILKVKGVMNRDIALKQDLEAHALGKQLGINRYLVDVTEARNIEPLADQYEFAYKDMQNAEGIDQNARVALLVAKGDHSHDFIETVSRNAGLHVRLFTNRKQAETYLRNDPPPWSSPAPDPPISQ